MSQGLTARPQCLLLYWAQRKPAQNAISMMMLPGRVALFSHHNNIITEVGEAVLLLCAILHAQTVVPLNFVRISAAWRCPADCRVADQRQPACCVLAA